MGALCDIKVPIKVKGKFDKISVIILSAYNIRALISFLAFFFFYSFRNP